MIKIKSESFFEEYKIFEKIFKKKKNKFLRILDLWCWNWRFNLLAQKIFEENNFNYKKIFYWVEKNFSENIKNFSDIFINTDINFFLENKKNFVWEKFFDFVILSGIFENFLKFDKKILNKIYKILEKDWVIFINFWNYWENYSENYLEKKWDEKKNIFREKNISEVKKYFEKNLLPEIKKSKFNLNKEIWEKFEVFYNEKQKNWGWNISLILNKN